MQVLHVTPCTILATSFLEKGKVIMIIHSRTKTVGTGANNDSWSYRSLMRIPRA